MKDWLQKQYLNPQGVTYLIIEALNQHFIIITGILSLFILSIPVFNFINSYQTENKYQTEIYQLNETLTQKEKLFLSIQARQKKLNSQDINIMQINQKLAELFKAYHIENENIQWDFENGKSMSINLTHRSATLFSLIETISAIPNLRIKELTLNKLDENRLVELNINLQLIAIEEE